MDYLDSGTECTFRKHAKTLSYVVQLIHRRERCHPNGKLENELM